MWPPPTPEEDVKCTQWSWAGGRQRRLGQQIVELGSRAAFTKRSSTADGARRAQGLPELSPADCNRTGCVFRHFFYFQRYCTGKKSYFSVSPAPSQLPLVLAAEPCWVAGERWDPCQGILCLCCQHEAAVLTDTPRQPKGVAPLFSGLYDICVG